MVKKTVNTETVKDTAKKTAQVVKQAARETGAVAKKAARETGTAAKKAAKETADSVKKTAKETSTVTKKAVKETADTVKRTAKKEYTRLALKETYIQVAGNEYKETEILRKVEESFLAAGNKITAMKNLQLYIKPEDNAAYYVVNGEITGRVDL